MIIKLYKIFVVMSILSCQTTQSSLDDENQAQNSNFDDNFNNSQDENETSQEQVENNFQNNQIYEEENISQNDLSENEFFIENEQENIFDLQENGNEKFANNLPLEESNQAQIISPPERNLSEIQAVDSEAENITTKDTVLEVSHLFSGAPPIKGTLRTLALGEAPEEYIVEFGDSLFDICEQLLGEGAYWPKLWSLNSYIKNPHFIWPGMRLRFYPGDEEEPPFIEVVQKEEVVPVAEEGEDIDMGALVHEIISSRELKIEYPKIDFVDYNEIAVLSEDIEVFGRRFKGDSIPVTLPGFIFSEKKMGSCIVLGGTQGEVILSEEQKFLCDPSEELENNSYYTAIRFSDIVENSEGEKIGYNYQFVAQVKVLRPITKVNKYLAMVTKNRLGLMRDDILIPYRSTKRVVSLQKNEVKSNSTEAQIVSFENDGSLLGGQGSMVFINKGLNDGVNPGQLLNIDQNLHYFMRSFAGDEPFIELTKVGFVRIIDATEVGAVGYIISNSEEIFKGAIVGRG